ncbi:MAG: trehalose-phosphatase [Hyphomicrobiaceae bacterium]
MTPPILKEPRDLAMFLDFDGTLVEIAEKPDAVRLADATRHTLTRLQRLLGGALAIVTGREIDVVDRMLSPFRCPVAGVHGLVRRDATGRAHAKAIAAGFLDAAEARLNRLASQHGALLVERKSHAIALHYRGKPELERACLDAMEEIAQLDDQVRLIRGKMVIEARPSGGDKGTAVADFMGEAPFAGRRPLFAGDDVTDEDAFRLVNARGGLTLKIGAGESNATYRLADTAAFLAWLAESADSMERGHSIG